MKLAIEIFWSFIIGLVFSMFPMLFYSGADGYVFQLGRWWSGLFKNNKHFGKLQNVLLGEKFNKNMLIKLICVSLVLSYTYNILYFEAYNALDSSIYAALENLEVVFGILIGYFVLNEKVGIRKIVGASAVIGGIIISIYGGKIESSIREFKLKR